MLALWILSEFAQKPKRYKHSSLFRRSINDEEKKFQHRKQQQKTFLAPHQWPYSSHFIFFVTYEWVQIARMLHYTRQERLPMDKHPSLLGLFISFEENKVL